MSDPTLDVVGIGNAIVDVIAEVEDAFLAEFDIQKGGMTLIDEARGEALYAAMPPAAPLSGGSAANTMAGVASFGGQAGFIGKVKDDQLGRIYAHDIRAVGATFQAPLAAEGPATGRSLILVTPDAERSMNTYLGAAATFGPDDVDAALIQSAKILYMEGYLFDRDEAKAAFRSAAEIAHAAGRAVALSLSDSFCVARHGDDFRALIEDEVDLVFGNEDELLALYDVPDFDGALQAIRASNVTAALTRGAAGSVLVAAEEVHVIDAVPPAQLIDTTGAGDQYAAGVLYGWTQGFDLGTCGRLGSLAAAEVIDHIGPRPHRPLRELAGAAVPA